MTSVFLDTVGLIAIWDEDDQWHSRALPVFNTLMTTRRLLVSTPWVLMECGNASARRPYRTAVCDLREALILSGGLIDLNPDELARSWGLYRSRPVGSAGIVDLTSFAIMHRLGITEAFTNDKHFTTAGFTVLF